MMVHTATCLKGPIHRSTWLHEEDSAPEQHDTPVVEDGIRWELVAKIRRQIAAGTYDTPEKFEQALERLMDQL